MLDVGKYEAITKKSIMIFILATAISSFNRIAHAAAPSFSEPGTPVAFSSPAVILKADLSEIANKNIILKYNGESQPIDISKSYKNSGTVYYRVGDTGSWNRTNPSFKEIGEYDVYYYVEGDENHNDLGGISNPVKLKVNVEVDKENWGEKTEDNGVVNYVDEKGMTSAEIDGNKMIWVREESLDHYDPVTGEPVITGAWYGVDNSSGVFAKGSRLWVRWLHPEYDREEWLEYYKELDEENKRRAQKEKLWIFLTGVTGPDGKEYTNLNVNVPYYIQLGDDWDKEDVMAYYISKHGDEMVSAEFDTVEGYNSRFENINFPETTGSYARLMLRHFSPYAVFDVLDSERETNIQEQEQETDNLEEDKIDDSDNKETDKVRTYGLRDVLNIDRFKKQDTIEEYPNEPEKSREQSIIEGSREKTSESIEKTDINTIAIKDMGEASNEEKYTIVEAKQKEISNKKSEEVSNKEAKRSSSKNQSSNIKTGDFDSRISYLIIICTSSLIVVVFRLRVGNKDCNCIEENILKMSSNELTKNYEQFLKSLKFVDKLYLALEQKSLMRQVPFRLIIYQYFGKLNIVLHIEMNKLKSIEVRNFLWIGLYEFYHLPYIQAFFLRQNPRSTDILRRLKPSRFLSHPATLSGVAPFGQVRHSLPTSLSADN